MKKNVFKAVIALSALVCFCGCTALESLSGDSYSRSDARTGNIVYPGTVLAVEDVTIEGTEGTAGGLGGGLLGGAVGSNVGGGNGRLVGAAAGAIVGAVAGSAVEHAATRRAGIEITVKYENGVVEAIVQEPGKDVFVAGQRVRVLVNDRGVKRVRPLNY